jgi:hypothetical protein
MMGKKVCLCGSFRFFDRIVEIERLLVGGGVTCNAPRPFEYRNNVQPAYFENKWDLLSYEDKLIVSKEAEQTFLEKIEKADILYVINPSGYIGTSVLFEIGYAFAKGKLVYSLEPIQDYAIMGLIKGTATPEALMQLLKEINPL